MIDLVHYDSGEFTGVTLDVQHGGSISTFNGVNVPYVGDFAALFPAVPEGDVSYRQSLYVGGGAATRAYPKTGMVGAVFYECFNLQRINLM